jgi:hypothetical protein
MAPADGKNDCLAVQSDRSQVMTGIMMLRGTSARLIAVELADHDDPWFVIPIVDGIEQGLPAIRIKPGECFERPTEKIPWIVVLDDRAPGASGPRSFKEDTLRWLFGDAYRIAVDAAEPHVGFYEYLVEEGLKGMCILVIRTFASRLGEWREFSRQNCELYGIAEVKNTGKPERPVTASVTRFNRH